QDIDIKHNSDPSACDTTFNKILVNHDARFLTELIDYHAKLTLNLSHTMKTLQLDEIEQVLQNYNNNFGRTENNFTLEEMCLFIAIDIHLLGGIIKKITVQDYKRNIKKKDSYI
ncbi:14818_t:CDS:2, partial [Funneliformis mosseae]